VTPPAGSSRGRYHTDRQPGAALQNTALCSRQVSISSPHHLHISTPSPYVLHRFSTCASCGLGDKGKARRGESAACFGCGMPVRSF
jgi:hypothetical protein